MSKEEQIEHIVEKVLTTVCKKVVKHEFPESTLAKIVEKAEEIEAEGTATLTNFIADVFPKFPALRVGDFDFGIPHAHNHPPNLVPPAPPIPLPSVGPVIPVGLGISGCNTVLINNQPAARCEDIGLGIWCGGFFPFYEILTGSSNVWIGGERAARMGIDITKHCILSKPRPKDYPIGAPFGFTIQGSPNVLIGGLPMPSFTALGMGLLFKGLLRLAKVAAKAVGKVAKAAAKTAARAARAAARAATAAARAATAAAKTARAVATTAARAAARTAARAARAAAAAASRAATAARTAAQAAATAAKAKTTAAARAAATAAQAAARTAQAAARTAGKAAQAAAKTAGKAAQAAAKTVFRTPPKTPL